VARIGFHRRAASVPLRTLGDAADRSLIQNRSVRARHHTVAAPMHEAICLLASTSAKHARQAVINSRSYNLLGRVGQPCWNGLAWPIRWLSFKQQGVMKMMSHAQYQLLSEPQFDRLESFLGLRTSVHGGE